MIRCPSTPKSSASVMVRSACMCRRSRMRTGSSPMGLCTPKRSAGWCRGTAKPTWMSYSHACCGLKSSQRKPMRFMTIWIGTKAAPRWRSGVITSLRCGLRRGSGALELGGGRPVSDGKCYGKCHMRCHDSKMAPAQPQELQESYVHRWLLVVQDFDLHHHLANAREKEE